MRNWLYNYLTLTLLLREIFVNKKQIRSFMTFQTFFLIGNCNIKTKNLCKNRKSVNVYVVHIFHIILLKLILTMFIMNVTEMKTLVKIRA